jgi:hypothetical protein
MHSGTTIGLGLLAFGAACCGWPLLLSLLVAGAGQGAAGAVWAHRSLLPLGVVMVATIGLLARGYASQVDERAACCAATGPTRAGAGTDQTADVVYMV